jgi:opacity protein-like surface antigen
MTQTFKTLRQVALVASLLLLPALASAQPRSTAGGFPSMGTGLNGWDYAGLLALDIPPSGLNVGPKIAGELMYGITDLAPNLRLKVGGRVAFSYHGASNVDGNEWILSAVPDVKLVYGINDLFAVYGDFGLGLAYVHASVGPFSDSAAKLAVEFGGGVAYALSPSMNLLGEIRLSIVDGDTLVALPTIGVQWH